MEWDSSGHWRGRRHGGNWWIAPLVILGLVILTHGWILILPLMALAALVLVGFVLPRLAWHVHNSDWHGGEWGNHWHEHWHDMKRQHMHDWHGRSRWHDHYDEKPKRINSDDIEYV